MGYIYRMNKNELEAHTLEHYMKELETMVSMPEFYKNNKALWSRMVVGSLRHPTDEKINWALLAPYEEIRHTPQHHLDWFVIQNHIVAWKWRDLSTEGISETFDVDRPTALKIKSIVHNTVYLEPEWIRINDI